MLKWLHYFDIYERHLSRFRNKQTVILEIGVHGGGSLAMWKEYLGADSQVIGVDIVPQCKTHEAEGIEIFIGSQDEPKLIGSILEKYPHIDVVLDDGSHMMDHMVSTFDLLYEKISSDGVYMVEDAHTWYIKKFGGGIKEEKSFIEFSKNKIDELNAAHTQGLLPVNDFTRGTDSISFYDGMVVYEKRRQSVRQAIVTQPS